MNAEEEKRKTKSKNKVGRDDWEFSTLDKISMTIFTLCFIAQFSILFFYEGPLDLLSLEIFGYIFFGLGALFGILPIIIFKRKGGVSRGESYINTQQIVTTGLYAFVRHPQYLSFIFLSLGLTLLSQTWINLILTVLIIILTYQWTFSEDKRLIDKFGEVYKQYKAKVPRFNLIWGVIKYVIRKN
jgi:protein-S-isoprenylcysteine O-methyltransferase Ste14